MTTVFVDFLFNTLVVVLLGVYVLLLALKLAMRLFESLGISIGGS